MGRGCSASLVSSSRVPLSARALSSAALPAPSIELAGAEAVSRGTLGLLPSARFRRSESAGAQSVTDSETLATATRVIFLAQALILGLLGMFSWRFTKRMRDHHATTWQELGAPSWSNLSVTTSRRLSAFVRRREYHRLRDRELDRWATGLRVIEKISATGFAALIASIVLRALVAG